MKVYKLYLVQYYYLGKRYYKCGITSSKDVMDRFKYDIQKYNLEKFRVIKSGYLKGFMEEDTKENELFKLIMDEFPENNYIKNGRIYNKQYSYKICRFIKIITVVCGYLKYSSYIYRVKLRLCLKSTKKSLTQ